MHKICNAEGCSVGSINITKKHSWDQVSGFISELFNNVFNKLLINGIKKRKLWLNTKDNYQLFWEYFKANILAFELDIYKIVRS